MKKVYVLFTILILSYGINFAQYPAKLTIESNGNLFVSPTTELGTKYIITVEGTYSMWPQFKDCRGVDAAYVYEVPKEELDAYRWPPDTILVPIVNVKIPFVTMPHWMGDDKLWQFPPKEISTPKFEMSFRKHKGFRIDNEPLPNTGIQSLTHRYQIEKMGTGSPFIFQILDSNYDILLEKVIERYGDNCGSLKVTIEKVLEEDINICDVQPICIDGKIVGMKLDAAIFATDTTSPTGKRNLLQNISTNQIGIVDNGKFICPIDSIKCSSLRTKNLAVGILVDRSGSMAYQISETDITPRMTASKNAINNFVDKMKDKDSAFVMSFSESSRLDQDWTNDKSKLKSSINALEPETSTGFYGALLNSLNKVSKSNNPLRALVVLTDGCNTASPNWSNNILTNVQNTNIPVYIIALGLSQDACDIDGRNKMGLIANSSRGKVYDVYNSKQLDSVYISLSQEISNDECCTIYFKVDPCTIGSERYIKLIYSPKDTTTLSKVVKFKCDTCKVASSIEIDYNNPDKSELKMEVSPNPFDQAATLTYNLTHSGNVVIQIVDFYGNIMSTIKSSNQETGNYNYTIDGSKFPIGTYLASVSLDGITVTRKIVVLR